jgi:hypothetical protein
VEGSSWISENVVGYWKAGKCKVCVRNLVFVMLISDVGWTKEMMMLGIGRWKED